VGLVSGTAQGGGRDTALLAFRRGGSQPLPPGRGEGKDIL